MKISKLKVDKQKANLIINFIGDDKQETSVSLSFEYLRVITLPSSKNTSKQGNESIVSHKKGVTIVNIESVAKHGYRFIFDDGHSIVYDVHELHVLALEYETLWAHYLKDLKASGHSREVMIDFKQL